MGDKGEVKRRTIPMDNLPSIESLLESQNKAIPNVHTSSISSMNTFDINEKIDDISLSSISITSDGIIKASLIKDSTTESETNKLDIRASQLKPSATKKLPLSDTPEAKKEEISENSGKKDVANEGKLSSVSSSINGLSDFDCSEGYEDCNIEDILSTSDEEIKELMKERDSAKSARKTQNKQNDQTSQSKISTTGKDTSIKESFEILAVFSAATIRRSETSKQIKDRSRKLSLSEPASQTIPVNFSDKCLSKKTDNLSISSLQEISLSEVDDITKSDPYVKLCGSSSWNIINQKNSNEALKSSHDRSLSDPYFEFDSVSDAPVNQEGTTLSKFSKPKKLEMNGYLTAKDINVNFDKNHKTKFTQTPREMHRVQLLKNNKRRTIFRRMTLKKLPTREPPTENRLKVLQRIIPQTILFNAVQCSNSLMNELELNKLKISGNEALAAKQNDELSALWTLKDQFNSYKERFSENTFTEIKDSNKKLTEKIHHHKSEIELKIKEILLMEDQIKKHNNDMKLLQDTNTELTMKLEATRVEHQTSMKAKENEIFILQNKIRSINLKLAESVSSLDLVRKEKENLEFNKQVEQLKTEKLQKEKDKDLRKNADIKQLQEKLKRCESDHHEKLEIIKSLEKEVKRSHEEKNWLQNKMVVFQKENTDIKSESQTEMEEVRQKFKRYYFEIKTEITYKDEEIKKLRETNLKMENFSQQLIKLCNDTANRCTTLEQLKRGTDWETLSFGNRVIETPVRNKILSASEVINQQGSNINTARQELDHVLKDLTETVHNCKQALINPRNQFKSEQLKVTHNPKLQTALLADDTYRELKIKISKQKSDFETCRAENTKLASRLTEMQTKYKDHSAIKRQNNALTKRCKNLQIEMDELRDLFKKANQDNMDSKHRIEIINKDIKMYKKQIQIYESKDSHCCFQLKIKKENLEAQVARMEKFLLNHQSIEEDFGKLKLKSDKLKRQLENSNKHIKDLEQELRDSCNSSSREPIERKFQENLAFTSAQSDRNQPAVTVNLNLDPKSLYNFSADNPSGGTKSGSISSNNKNIDNENNQEAMTKLQNEIARLGIEKRTLETKIKNLEENYSFPTLTKQIDTLLTENLKLSKHIVALENKIEKLNEDIALHGGKIKEADNEILCYKNKLKSLQVEVEAAQKQLLEKEEEFETEINKLQKGDHKELRGLRNQLFDLLSQRQENEKLIKNLKEEKYEMKMYLERLEKENEGLKMKAESVQSGRLVQHEPNLSVDITAAPPKCFQIENLRSDTQRSKHAASLKKTKPLWLTHTSQDSKEDELQRNSEWPSSLKSPDRGKCETRQSNITDADFLSLDTPVRCSPQNGRTAGNDGQTHDPGYPNPRSQTRQQSGDLSNTERVNTPYSRRQSAPPSPQPASNSSSQKQRAQLRTSWSEEDNFIKRSLGRN